MIAGDEDGIVCVPKDRIDEVYEGALAKLKKDEEREEKVLGNREAAIEYLEKQLK
ncbi:hypothetical protein SAMN05421676_101326 [Salinibacillus kushneri]|uniref:Uncharacterized protein n=1 Tax=Salinibacillus kushneri TaxID=237682 RepID=A0A1H9YX72_9BACI|nr:hypothetical protein [Salinibacillus kushneri]SES73812.1 hypothetical protein SAMN05421676_101326 [Salinibacillus kushneri]